MATQSIVSGSRVPNVKLGYVEGGDVYSVNATELFRSGRSIVIGVPGAFTPVCTKQHIPDFVKNAATLRGLGFTQLVCIAANDPFVLAEWAGRLDPEGKLRFFSDGNLDFATALGLQMDNRDLFMSGRSERYMLTIQDNVITRLRVEPSILVYSCTRVADVVKIFNVEAP